MKKEKKAAGRAGVNELRRRGREAWRRAIE